MPTTRVLLAAAFATLAAGAVAQPVQQPDPVKERNTLMFEMGEHAYGDLNKMVRGEQPYDQAKVDAGLNSFTETAPKLPPLWPTGSTATAEGSDYHSSPKIWENKVDFDRRLAKFQKDAGEARGKVKSLDELKATYETLVRQNCNSCHQEYRVRNR